MVMTQERWAHCLTIWRRWHEHTPRPSLAKAIAEAEAALFQG